MKKETAQAFFTHVIFLGSMAAVAYVLVKLQAPKR